MESNQSQSVHPSLADSSGETSVPSSRTAQSERQGEQIDAFESCCEFDESMLPSIACSREELAAFDADPEMVMPETKANVPAEERTIIREGVKANEYSLHKPESEIHREHFFDADCVDDATTPFMDSSLYESSMTAQSVQAVEGIDYISLESQWVSMPNGEQLHMRRLTPVFHAEYEMAVTGSVSEPPTRMFMLHGEAESSSVYFHESGRGLAYYFANQGYEVFVADLSGRGRSLLPEGVEALSTDQLITEAIPRLLRSIAQTPALDSELPDSGDTARHAEGHMARCAASVWVGHGFGGVLLSAAWARMLPAEKTATEMIFFGTRRRTGSSNFSARVFQSVLCHPLTARLVGWCNGFPAGRIRLGEVDESLEWYQVYSHWMQSADWVGNDGFDYAAALADQPVPATLHFTSLGDHAYAPQEDVRAFVEELGCHDARTVVLDTIEGSKQRYNHVNMLLDSRAEAEVFSIARNWLNERSALSGNAPDNAGEYPYMDDKTAANFEARLARELDENKKTLNLCA